MDVRVEYAGNYKIITINRPEARNALRLQTVEELLGAFRERAGDTRAVILRGAGDAFSAGADIKAMSTFTQEDARTFSKRARDLIMLIEGLPTPVIASVAGPAIGAGLDLVLASDLAVASDDAVFGHGGAALGITTPFGGTTRLARAVGPKIAKEMWFAGRRLSAAEALSLGIVNHVVPRERLEEKTLEVADRLSDHSPLSIQYVKSMINMSFQMGFELDELERDLYVRCFGADDRREGLSAFLEKRRAVFKQR